MFWSSQCDGGFIFLQKTGSFFFSTYGVPLFLELPVWSQHIVYVGNPVDFVNTSHFLINLISSLIIYSEIEL